MRNPTSFLLRGVLLYASLASTSPLPNNAKRAVDARQLTATEGVGFELFFGPYTPVPTKTETILGSPMTNSFIQPTSSAPTSSASNLAPLMSVSSPPSTETEVATLASLGDTSTLGPTTSASSSGASTTDTLNIPELTFGSGVPPIETTSPTINSTGVVAVNATNSLNATASAPLAGKIPIPILTGSGNLTDVSNSTIIAPTVTTTTFSVPELYFGPGTFTSSDIGVPTLGANATIGVDATLTTSVSAGPTDTATETASITVVVSTNYSVSGTTTGLVMSDTTAPATDTATTLATDTTTSPTTDTASAITSGVTPSTTVTSSIASDIGDVLFFGAGTTSVATTQTSNSTIPARMRRAASNSTSLPELYFGPGTLMKSATTSSTITLMMNTTSTAYNGPTPSLPMAGSMIPRHYDLTTLAPSSTMSVNGHVDLMSFGPATASEGNLFPKRFLGPMNMTSTATTATTTAGNGHIDIMSYGPTNGAEGNLFPKRSMSYGNATVTASPTAANSGNGHVDLMSFGPATASEGNLFPKRSIGPAVMAPNATATLATSVNDHIDAMSYGPPGVTFTPGPLFRRYMSSGNATTTANSTAPATMTMVDILSYGPGFIPTSSTMSRLARRQVSASSSTVDIIPTVTVMPDLSVFAAADATAPATIPSSDVLTSVIVEINSDMPTTSLSDIGGMISSVVTATSSNVPTTTTLPGVGGTGSSIFSDVVVGLFPAFTAGPSATVDVSVSVDVPATAVISGIDGFTTTVGSLSSAVQSIGSVANDFTSAVADVTSTVAGATPTTGDLVPTSTFVEVIVPAISAQFTASADVTAVVATGTITSTMISDTMSTAATTTVVVTESSNETSVATPTVTMSTVTTPVPMPTATATSDFISSIPGLVALIESVPGLSSLLSSGFPFTTVSGRMDIDADKTKRQDAMVHDTSVTIDDMGTHMTDMPAVNASTEGAEPVAQAWDIPGEVINHIVGVRHGRRGRTAMRKNRIAGGGK